MDSQQAFIRVQALVPDLPVSSETLDLSDLRKSIKQLQSASLHLDKEKIKAEKKLKAILKRFFRHRGHGKCGKVRTFGRIADWIERMSGVQPHYKHLHRHDDAWKGYLGPIDSRSLKKASASGDLHRFPIRKLVKAAMRVRKANQKIIAFERGFISEGGIKDREWYKHLGVAPGKWLGNISLTDPSFVD